LTKLMDDTFFNLGASAEKQQIIDYSIGNG